MDGAWQVQHSTDVVDQRLQALANRTEATTAQQVHRRSPQQGFWGGAQAREQVEDTRRPLAFTGPAVISSTIQLLPGQLALMSSGAASVQ